MSEGEEEGETMDKKSGLSRPPAAPVKASGSDCRKADNGNGNRYSKNPRRREPNGSRPRSDNVPFRRYPPQRPRQTFDKRPRPREYSNDYSPREITEEGAELGSVHRPGPKKGNLNHLLNFTFAPRDTSSSGGTNWKGRNKWSGGRYGPKYNKEQFLQANCQFIVRDTGDYQVHAVDPDVLVDWALIEQIRIGGNEVPSCPICLYPPTAAKITRCGHVYCWSCVLHYLSLGDKSYRKCPICYEEIVAKDLKSVKALENHRYEAHQTITMKLMKRKKGSIYAMPRKQWAEREGKLHGLDDGVDTFYAKLLIATKEQVQKIIDEEKVALEHQLVQEKDSLEGSFIQAAMNHLKDRQTLLNIRRNASDEVSKTLDKLNIAEEEILKPTTEVFWQTKADAKVYASAFSDEEAESTEEPSSSPDTESGGKQEPPSCQGIQQDAVMQGEVVEADAGEIPMEEAEEQLALPSPEQEGEEAKGASSQGKQASDHFYYYQAEDGQHIYLHSLNARCLLKEYGYWENCPDSITAKIIETEGISMNAELRRRLRYLSHLPLTCEFRVAELALKPPILSKSTLEAMSDEIEKRRRTRQRKARDEQRKLKKMEEQQKRMMGYYPDMRMNLQSVRHFPAASGGTELHVDTASQPSTTSSSTSSPFGSPLGSTDLNPNASEFVPGSPPPGNDPDEGHQHSSTPSFAQMLRQGKTRAPEAWPKPKSEIVSGVSKAGKASGDSEDSENEDRVPVPVFQASFGDAIQAALDSYQNVPDKDKPTEALPSGKKKKVPTATLR